MCAPRRRASRSTRARRNPSCRRMPSNARPGPAYFTANAGGERKCAGLTTPQARSRGSLRRGGDRSRSPPTVRIPLRRGSDRPPSLVRESRASRSRTRNREHRGRDDGEGQDADSNDERPADDAAEGEVRRVADGAERLMALKPGEGGVHLVPLEHPSEAVSGERDELWGQHRERRDDAGRNPTHGGPCVQRGRNSPYRRPRTFITTSASARKTTAMNKSATDRVRRASRPQRDPTKAPTSASGNRIGMIENSGGTPRRST